MPVNQEERAYRAWGILTAVASKSNGLITYGELGAAISVHPRAIRYVLGVIQAYCLDQKLPPLTILVVNAQDRTPSSGFIAWDVDDLPEGLRKVRNYAWSESESENPFLYASKGDTEQALAAELDSNPEKAADIYARVKVRGTAQSIFRKALLLAYQGQCAICGLSFEDALQAAHLIEWNACSAAQRMATCNGLLLCATHHRLFDWGYITITPDHTVYYVDPEGRDGWYSSADSQISTALHGKKAFMPKDRRHWPSAECLGRHHKAHLWQFHAL